MKLLTLLLTQDFGLSNDLQKSSLLVELDGRPFNLEGKTMCTPVYIKISAKEDLLLSEGVCQQLAMISYHPSIARQKGKTSQNKSVTSASEEGDATISTVRVCLIQ